MEDKRIYIPRSGLTVLIAPEHIQREEWEGARRALKSVAAEPTQRWIILPHGWTATYLPDPSRYMNPPDYWGPVGSY